jgi:Delta14-sterol reductase
MSPKLNPRTTSYEFLGPLGALAISVGVPITTYALYFGCSEATGGCPPQLTSVIERIVQSVSNLDWWDTETALTYLAWYTFCVVAWAGDQVEGTTYARNNIKLMV